MRDVAWGFFYGTVNFDHVIGTINHYGTVELFAGLMNEAFVSANRHYVEKFDSKDLRKVFVEILDNWTSEGFDPFASPEETGKPFGAKHGENRKALERERVVAKRMVGLPGDVGYRTTVESLGYDWSSIFVYDEAHLSDYWAIVLKYKRLVVTCLLGALIAASIFTLVSTPQFQATVVVDVTRQGATLTIPVTLTGHS